MGRTFHPYLGCRKKMVERNFRMDPHVELTERLRLSLGRLSLPPWMYLSVW